MTVASHELRTPLAAVHGYAQMLASDDAPNQREAIAEILTAARRMGAIVETLDELGSLRNPAGEIPAERVDLRDVVTGPPQAETEGIDRQVDVTGLEAPVWVDGDARRLRLAFGHLLANADAFTASDGRIWLEAETDDDAVTVRVCDSGVGLAAADLERIFEPFVQADAPDMRPHEGLGVGLTLARSVVLRHGGPPLGDERRGRPGEHVPRPPAAGDVTQNPRLDALRVRHPAVSALRAQTVLHK